jgi:TatD DNase family protein
MIDIGANLTSGQFRQDLLPVLERSWQAGVSAIIVTGTTAKGSLDAWRMTKSLGQGRLYSTAGVHPHYAQQYDDGTHEQLRTLLHHQAVVAVGELGLDFDRNFSTPEAQRSAFKRQLELAIESGKPLFLHQRCAHDDFLAILRSQWAKGALPGVVHCFTGTREEAKTYLDLGLDIGVTGWVCDSRRNAELLDALEIVPLDRLHLETDAPYLLPPGLRKTLAQGSRRNEPAFLRSVAEGLAARYAMPVEKLVMCCTENSRRLFPGLALK